MGEFSASFPVENLINQSALSGTYTSGVDDFATTVATISHGQNVGEWASPVGTTTGNLDFDLGADLYVTQLVLWDSRLGAGEGDRSINDFTVLTDTNQSFTSSTNVGTFTNPRDVLDGTVFDLTDSSARFVRIQIQSNYGANLTQMGEVAFASGVAAVPEPSACAFLGLIGVAIACCRRRRDRALRT